MNINHIKDDKCGCFIATENAVEVGRITYVMSGETKLIIEHTVVNPAYEGHGLGKKLVFAVVDYARANNLKILPVCTFAKAVFDKTPEIQDVLF
jgi:predicted GNAT family acetyltransferase